MAFFWSSGKSGTSSGVMALIGTFYFHITIINKCRHAPLIRNEEIRVRSVPWLGCQLFHAAERIVFRFKST